MRYSLRRFMWAAAAFSIWCALGSIATNSIAWGAPSQADWAIGYTYATMLFSCSFAVGRWA